MPMSSEELKAVSMEAAEAWYEDNEKISAYVLGYMEGYRAGYAEALEWVLKMKSELPKDGSTGGEECRQ